MQDRTGKLWPKSIAVPSSRAVRRSAKKDDVTDQIRPRQEDDCGASEAGTRSVRRTRGFALVKPEKEAAPTVLALPLLGSGVAALFRGVGA
jgi:hypothetical protein